MTEKVSTFVSLPPLSDHRYSLWSHWSIFYLSRLDKRQNIHRGHSQAPSPLAEAAPGTPPVACTHPSPPLVESLQGCRVAQASCDEGHLPKSCWSSWGGSMGLRRSSQPRAAGVDWLKDRKQRRVVAHRANMASVSRSHYIYAPVYLSTVGLSIAIVSTICITISILYISMYLQHLCVIDVSVCMEHWCWDREVQSYSSAMVQCSSMSESSTVAEYQ